MSDRESTIEVANTRLAELRHDVPNAIVQIDSVRADDTAIAVKATIGSPAIGRHTAIYALDVDGESSWADQMELAQAIAVTRALDGLGFRADQPDSAAIQSAEAPAPDHQTPGERAAQRVDGDHLPEYSWTSFWQVAHARNISREQVEQALGKTLQQATPKEAVDALQAAGMWG